MKDNGESESSASENVSDASRRRFLRNSVAAGAEALALAAGGAVPGALAAAASAAQARGKQPNFLILMCDENRFPPVYESPQTQAFRHTYLKTQNQLRRNGVDFQRHYAASVACSPSRASIYTGQYPSLHGVSQTTGAAKESFDPDVFWLDPGSVPTLGDYFRAAGYETYWRGKWHASDADMLIPGTHAQFLSYNSKNGAPDADAEALYSNAERLDRFGFSGWIGPEPHGKSPLNSGSSVPRGQQGRDVGFAQQARDLIRKLDHDGSTSPWFIVSSFVNPHDITLWGLWANTGQAGDFDFTVHSYVPELLFDPEQFKQTRNDNLANKPSAQASYQESYGKWMQPIFGDTATLEKYFRYYYQLQKNVDDQMMTVFQALLGSRFADNTIVLFTSDHGDLLGSHDNMHQKWYTAYDEAIRVPLIIYSKTLFPQPRSVDSLTSHVDLLPTLLGLAGIDPEPIRKKLSEDHTDAQPLVGRNLAPLVLGEVAPENVNDPLYFMTDDDPSRGLNQDNWTGIGYNSVVQPNHLETVIARLSDGKVWKYTHYFDNPQFWSTPGYPGDRRDPNYPNVDDVVLRRVGQIPAPPPYRDDDLGPQPIAYTVTVKSTPHPDEYEMYNVTDDPMELANLADDRTYRAQKSQLEQLLQKERCAKRLVPQSGTVPGQPTC
ncbi:sulfatase-like hydrolase/transferase [Paraburkholderia ginsengiterrae]|uniref:Arylsulfatase n=1 Tax=Paraburkholderia ginsengiterrae TaxID=1462993 RepID=A0A1A9NBM7_9BURK|nr:sulfatase-like hydrolase/transferase [Paraburkholderia ginsengiterrae]OAJ63225.1 arylsulfatase [Paraburkholderia ginsengiterrae]